MPAIFYDLETTDTLFCGQIINYCFIAVDNNFTPYSSLKGLVKISRLQLPTPSAILANKTNVIDHQKLATDSEIVSMRKISAFIQDTISEANTKVTFIGYNSTKFDLPFLRTSLIRNGLNPYFNGCLVYKDLLQGVRYLSCHEKSFPRPVNNEKQSLSLSLEAIAKGFNLLSTAQKHESEEDVVLTIDLAKYLKEEFNFNILTFDAYEGASFESSQQVISRVLPNYSINHDTNDYFSLKPVVCLDSDYRYSLWIDLEKFAESKDKSAIFWVNKRGGELFCSNKENSKTQARIADEALNYFENINLANYFQRSICDIEQDIYRLDMDAINALHQAIWFKNDSPLKKLANRDLNMLFSRFKLANYSPKANDESFFEKLNSFLDYKYSGKMVVNKFHEKTDENQPSNYHVSKSNLDKELDNLLKSEVSLQDRELLNALKQYSGNFYS